MGLRQPPDTGTRFNGVIAFTDDEYTQQRYAWTRDLRKEQRRLNEQVRHLQRQLEATRAKLGRRDAELRRVYDEHGRTCNTLRVAITRQRDRAELWRGRWHLASQKPS